MLAGLLDLDFVYTTSGIGADKRSHPVAKALCAVVDHVTPQSRGGNNSPANLVTACGVCNYTKGDWGLAALGLADPFERPPHDTVWDGLTAFFRVAGSELPARPRGGGVDKMAG